MIMYKKFKTEFVQDSYGREIELFKAPCGKIMDIFCICDDSTCMDDECLFGCNLKDEIGL